MKSFFKTYTYKTLNDFKSMTPNEIVHIHPSIVNSDINFASVTTLSQDQIDAVKYLQTIKRNTKSQKFKDKKIKDKFISSLANDFKKYEEPSGKLVEKTGQKMVDERLVDLVKAKEFEENANKLGLNTTFAKNEKEKARALLSGPLQSTVPAAFTTTVPTTVKFATAATVPASASASHATPDKSINIVNMTETELTKYLDNYEFDDTGSGSKNRKSMKKMPRAKRIGTKRIRTKAKARTRARARARARTKARTRRI